MPASQRIGAEDDLRVLVLAPTGRDGPLAASALDRAGIHAEVCADVATLVRALDTGCGAMLIAEEALDRGATGLLLDRVTRQPAWSDVPLILLTAPGRQADDERALLQRLMPLGNVTLVSRPVRVVVLVNTIQTALRARRRQYQQRDHLRRLAVVEDRLRRSEWLHRSLAETLPQVVFVTRDDGSVEYLNERWREYTGRGVLVGDRRWEEAVHEEDRPRLARERAATLAADGELLESSVRLRRHDGVYRWFLCRAVPVRDGRGRLLRWIGSLADVDEQQRSRQILEDARAKAESANRAKDEFLAMLSHELRSPLGAITTWTHLLRSGRLDGERTSRAVEIIERSARAQAQIVEDLLDVSRIIAGKLRLEMRTVAFAPVVEAALDAIRPAADAKNVHLAVALDPDVGAVHGDAHRLAQVVTNLLANAVKFTPEGGAVRVALQAEGTWLRLMVADTGTGIAPDFLPRVFDRFEQEDGSTTRSHGGLGLGLAIVRHLIEGHRGAVFAESEGPGRGAIFTVLLPRLSEEAAADRTPVEGAPLDGVLRDVRVLVVDDDALAREALVATLQYYGATTAAAGSVVEALAQIEVARPDVIVSDVAMPEHDGLELVRRVRRRRVEDGGAIPAVAVTAHGGGEDRARALAAGFQAHVAKPFAPDRLVALLRALVRPALDGR